MAMAGACRLAVLAALAALTARAQEVTPESLRDLLLRSGGGLRHGVCEDRGAFLVAVVELEGEGEQGLADARIYAAGLFSEFLGAEVSRATSDEYREAVVDDVISVQAKFQTQTKVESERMIAGVETLSLTSFEAASWLTFVLSERTKADASAIAAAARSRAKGGGPRTVRVVGVAPILDGAVGQSEALATESAKRSALEMVVGVAMAGMKFSRYEDTDGEARSRFVDQTFSTTSGFLESFEVLESERQGGTWFVRAAATVSPDKVLDNYRQHLASIGDPVFRVSGGEAEGLPAQAAAFFRGKGFKIADAQSRPDWEIVLSPNFTPWSHPARGTPGFQCHLEITIKNARTGTLLAGVQSDGRASDFGGGGDAAQRARCAKKAFADAKERIQEQLTKSIVELARAGRDYELRLVREGASLSLEELARVKAQLRTLPGVKSVDAKLEGLQLKLPLRSLLPLADLAPLFEDDLTRLMPGHRAQIIGLSSEVAEWKLTPKDN